MDSCLNCGGPKAPMNAYCSECFLNLYYNLESKAKEPTIYKITQSIDGWLIEQIKGESVYPPTIKKTALEVARRFLQLIDVKEAKAQDWPEEHCVGEITLE